MDGALTPRRPEAGMNSFYGDLKAPSRSGLPSASLKNYCTQTEQGSLDNIEPSIVIPVGFDLQWCRSLIMQRGRRRDLEGDRIYCC